MTIDQMPTYADLLQPVLTALHELGGIAATFMIDDAVVERLELPRSVMEQTRESPPGLVRSEIGYRIAWARTYLKNYGLIENPQRGLWQLTALGAQTKTINPSEVVGHMNYLKRVSQQELNS